MAENTVNYESDPDSSNSAEDRSDDEEVDQNGINRLNSEIETNPFNYDPHVQRINSLRKAGDLDKLRHAREKMSEIFPLTADLWMDWLTDESKLAISEAERESVAKLFERAVRDYLSVPLWLEYAQFSIGGMGVKDGLENVRSVFERAITAVGLHVTQGAMIWEAYREFENAILGTMQPGLDSETQNKTKQQSSRVLNIFKRQLTIPLFDMEKTFEEYKEWVKGEVDPQVHQAYKKAKMKLEKLIPLEEELLSSESPHLSEYLKYIDFEIKEGDPARIQCIYERTLADNCLVPDIWKNYTKFLDTQLKIPSLSLSTHERAVRNCPWSVILWINYIQALERYKQPYDKVKETVDRALQAGFTQEEEFRQLWLTFLDYLRRRIDWNGENAKELSELRETFERVVDHMNQSFGSEADPSCTILQYWAKIEAKFCKNMTRARELWNNIINQGRGSGVRIWLEYANLERMHGDDKHYRRVLLRGLHSATDWPETLGEMLINFEREEGTLESLDSSTEKYEAQMKRLHERRQKIEEKEAERQYQASERKKQMKVEKKAASRKPVDTVAHKQQPGPYVEEMDVDEEGFKVPPLPSSKNQKSQPFISSPPPGVKEKSTEPPAKKLKIDMAHAEGEQSVKHDHINDNRTVFLSNLAYSVADEKIKEIFSELGEITEIRLVKDYRGRSKGYCYLEFASQDSAKAALKKDRQLVEGRPIFISKCEDKSMSLNKNKLKFPVQLEKHKLFIRGLPLSTTEQKLEDIFKEYGELKDVRLVTYRNGHSKGLAYVEYCDEVSAATALVKTDGMKVDDKTISVAISNPPERKSFGKTGGGEGSENKIIASLGGGREPGPRGRGRTQVSLLPRALQRTQPGTSRSNDFQNGINGAGEDVNTTKKQLTNNDFRNMLLKK
ncbi:spliceosome associated factor 3, U4/U6 recycling protein-like isoform X2 [Tachypleus tridentatus]|uniref:spliceosome associated factor 3, U4/U6 recycling protein-like isoform X2 n=1 Tax=Tachypleus tridentatus TaxID=6853 RepID=UPI003FD5914D